MKTIKILFFGLLLLLASSLQSQISINVHVGTPPMWGPAGYNDVRYYYLPDVQAYYDVQTSQFIYISGNHWIHRTYLPTRYRNYDLYHGYKVVINDYRGNSPYIHYKEHKVKYKKGYRGAEQKNIGERNHNDSHEKSRVSVQKKESHTSKSHGQKSSKNDKNHKSTKHK